MALAIGDRIGPYEIVACLGSGGMGEVYQARDLRLGRAVAIKVLSSARDTAPAEIARFQREAKAIARLSHPHICTLHDVGERDAVPFLVMELVEGVTLAERLERGPVPLGEALVAGVQIAKALDAAHRNGVVHRDLKPGNVMLTPNGVKLLDFGLAKLRDGAYSDDVGAPTKSVRLTDDGTVLGTLPYMAPEQVEGLEADARTDIFALGVVLYEMISGESPFRGNSRAGLTAAILTHHPPPIGSRAGAVPATVDRVVQKCLAKSPEDRWQSARDLASALEWSAGGWTVENHAPPATPPRKGRVASIAIGLIAAAIGLGGFAVWAFGRSSGTLPPRETTAAYRQVTFRRGAVSSARFTPDGQSFVSSASWENRPWGMYLGRAQSPDVRDLEVDDARILSISRAGDMAMLVGPQNIIRAFGTRTLARVPMAGGARRDLDTGIVDADWIPGTDTLAVVRDPGGGRPWTVEFPIGRIVHETRAAWSLRVSPDGARVAFFEGPAVFESAPSATVMVIDRSGGKSTIAQRLSGIGLAWTPRGDEVWFTATRPGGHGPHIMAASLAGVERAVHRAPDWLMLHDIAADGKVLLSRNSIRQSLSCQSKMDREERDRGWMLSSIVHGLSGDGMTAVFEDGLTGQTSAGNRTVFLRRLDGSAAIPLGEGFEPKLSPDGKWALVRIEDKYSLLPTGTGSIATLAKGDLGRLLGAAWFPDSKRIAFAAIPPGEKRARGYIQDVPNGNPRAITPPAVYLSGKQATVLDEHSILGLAEAEGRWMIYPLNGGAPRAVPGVTGRDVPVQWSPDGRFLYVFLSQPPPTRPGFDVFRIEVASGRRTLWKTLQPTDPVGVENFPGTLVMTRDASSYCYSYMRRLGDLFVVEGLE